MRDQDNADRHDSSSTMPFSRTAISPPIEMGQIPVGEG
jgi:hypothetical protein